MKGSQIINENGTKRYLQSGLRLTGCLFLLLLGIMQPADLSAQNGVRKAAARTENREQPITFQVFPNPNAGKFTVVVKDPEQSFDINVYNLIGEMVYHWESGDAGSANLEINLSKQPKGVYLIELDTERANMIKKVVIDNEKGG